MISHVVVCSLLKPHATIVNAYLNFGFSIATHYLSCLWHLPSTEAMASDRIHTDATNRGPLVNIITWILLVVMCLASILKVFTKWILIRNLQYDDAFTVFAMLFAVGYGIAVSFQVDAGLGQHIGKLTVNEYAQYQKAVYASQIMYTISLAFAKQTVLQLFAILARNSPRVRLVYGVSAASALFAIIMVVSVSFQCSPPHTWEILSSRCFDQAAFWKAFAVLDIAIDVSTAVLAGIIFHGLNMPAKIKIPVIIAFSARAFLLPLVSIRLVHVLDTLHSLDRPYDDFIPVILTSICANGSVIITCVPFLKPVIKGIQSGILAGDIRSLAPLGNSQSLFSTAHKTPGNSNSSNTKNIFKLKQMRERGDSQEQMIREIREVRVDVSIPEPALSINPSGR
ncbi:hypothetical protein BCR34DRAFT_78853 [Clohesyomyces aquaticus]|uniref:Rhodopsin domain-containing protein n=1 Tax=Clohesyomyces aquaticus TaxID=1231657 RepID=A0A1Y1YY29_9PLEO|nr:hypothetical protein BCR34DRAFT_78853 [Clohesyomyces aquaticus]